MLRAFEAAAIRSPMADDWRLETLRTQPDLRGMSFVRKSYKAYRPGWEHDHCAACGVTLAESDVQGDDIIHEGYAITSEYERGAEYEWVCVRCFADFKEVMCWSDVTTS